MVSISATVSLYLLLTSVLGRSAFVADSPSGISTNSTSTTDSFSSTSTLTSAFLNEDMTSFLLFEILFLFVFDVEFTPSFLFDPFPFIFEDLLGSFLLVIPVDAFPSSDTGLEITLFDTSVSGFFDSSGSTGLLQLMQNLLPSLIKKPQYLHIISFFSFFCP